jgi:hypothetical protein
VGQRKGTLGFEIGPSILGASIVSFFMSDGPIKVAHYKKKKKNLNLRGTLSN